jgi:hypothetical protein
MTEFRSDCFPSLSVLHAAESEKFRKRPRGSPTAFPSGRRGDRSRISSRNPPSLFDPTLSSERLPDIRLIVPHVGKELLQRRLHRAKTGQTQFVIDAPQLFRGIGDEIS